MLVFQYFETQAECFHIFFKFVEKWKQSETALTPAEKLLPPFEFSFSLLGSRINLYLLDVTEKKKIDLVLNKFSKKGSTEIWTRIAGFKVQSANHYTMEPHDVNDEF